MIRTLVVWGVLVLILTLMGTCYLLLDKVCRLTVFIKKMREEVDMRRPIPIELWDHCYDFILDEKRKERI